MDDISGSFIFNMNKVPFSPIKMFRRMDILLLNPKLVSDFRSSISVLATVNIAFNGKVFLYDRDKSIH